MTPGEDIVLVDEHDREIGSAPKLPPHQNGGQLHRAFSIFIFNRVGDMLLQRRALGKYHFGGLWTNACCSHPRPGERVSESASRRLMFEFGFNTPLQPLFTFIYRAEDPVSGLTEHELDHVFVGQFDGDPQPTASEIAEYRWLPPLAVLQDVVASPALYTPWFRLVLNRVLEEVARMPS